jgi:hypothetical protein
MDWFSKSESGQDLRIFPPPKAFECIPENGDTDEMEVDPYCS